MVNNKNFKDRAVGKKYDGETPSGDNRSNTIQAPTNIFGAIDVGMPTLAKLNTRSASC